MEIRWRISKEMVAGSFRVDEKEWARLQCRFRLMNPKTPELYSTDIWSAWMDLPVVRDGD